MVGSGGTVKLVCIMYCAKHALNLVRVLQLQGLLLSNVHTVKPMHYCS